MSACFDAHNHLQDPRFAPHLDEIVDAMQEAGVERCVVNGTCEEDWPRVTELARRFPDLVLPSYGLHPWFAADRSPDWLTTLTEHLDAHPQAGLGECGLDRWIKDYDLNDQREVFLAQLSLAADRNLPLSIHCLKAWGPLLDCLRDHPLPARGFLLHSYGGSRELVAELASLGAWFSFSGAFLHPRKAARRDAFLAVPPDRLLVETDAPDMLPPPEARLHHLRAPDGSELNHPANLPATVEALGTDPAALAENFRRFFES